MCICGIYISRDFSTTLLCLDQVYNLLASLGLVSQRRIFLSYLLNIQGVSKLWPVGYKNLHMFILHGILTRTTQSS